jgi:CDP-diacylglycerol--glycerol-3-phosphate 3-phosphatidyltransferase
VKIKIWTIPNFITSLRVILVPFVIFCFYEGSQVPTVGMPDNRWVWWLVSLNLLGICELTDIVDGYLARFMHQVSEFGKLLDPLCDSLVRFSIFLALSQLDIVPDWTVYIFFYRDLSVAYLRILAMSKGVVFAARLSGKIKAIVQGVGIFIIVGIQFFNSLGIDMLFGYCEKEKCILYVMVLVCAVTIWSGLDYAYKIFSLEDNNKAEN